MDQNVFAPVAVEIESWAICTVLSLLRLRWISLSGTVPIPSNRRVIVRLKSAALHFTPEKPPSERATRSSLQFEMQECPYTGQRERKLHDGPNFI
jgi:hypothetical protein